MKIKIKKLRDNATVPEYQTEHSAGMDLHAAIDEPIILRQGDIYAVPIGIAVGIPVGYEMQVRGRSGLALKHGVAPAAGVGTIDADFRGEIHAILINNGKSDFVFIQDFFVGDISWVCHIINSSFSSVCQFDDDSHQIINDGDRIFFIDYFFIIGYFGNEIPRIFHTIHGHS